MALKITDYDEYNDPTSAFPDGSLKNRVYDGDDIDEEGTEVLGGTIQDLLNPFHKMGRVLGKFLNGVADTQIASQFYDWVSASMLHLGGGVYSATSANGINYNVTRAQSPLVYQAGLCVSFTVPTTNVGTNAVVNVNSMGNKNISDHELGAGEPPSLQVGQLKAGEHIRLVYTVRASDSYNYFLLQRASLGLLSEGTAALEDLVGGVTRKLGIGLDAVTQELNSSTYTKSLTSTASNLTSIVERLSTSHYWYVILDYLNAIVHTRATSLQGYGLLEGRLGVRGLQFVNGPLASTTDSIWWRFARYSLPLGVAEFGSADGKWGCFAVGAPGTFYQVDTDIPANFHIYMMFATYSTADGQVRSAPCTFRDTGVPGSTTNIIEFSVHASDGGYTPFRPIATNAGDFVELTILFNAGGLTTGTPSPS